MATLNQYWAGNEIIFSVTFIDQETLDPIDPTAVEFSFIVQPNPVIRYLYGVDSAITRLGVGAYQVNVDSTGLAGTWDYVWASHGTGQGVLSRSIIVNAPAISPSF